MADEIAPVAPLSAEDNNKKVAEDLLKQGLESVNKPEDLTAAGDALDALAKDVVEKKEEPVVEKKEETVVVEPTAEQKAAAEQLKAQTEAAEKLFKDSPGLPPNASPKSHESFTAIKVKAAQEISQREAELEKIRKELAELQEKSKNPVPPELQKELEDHRNWRAKLDVDADPKFKQFDKRIAESQEFIYAQLKKSPAVTDEVIAAIKKNGGPEKVKFEKLFAAINDPTIQRLVEAKVAEIELTQYDKEKAIAETKENVSKYMEERTKQQQAGVQQHNVATKQRVDGLVATLDWIKPKTIDEKADAATKAAATEHNAFVTEVQQQLAAALQDDSAEMRAILLVGMAQLFNNQRETAGLKKDLEARTKELADVTEKWNRVKAASTTRLREGGAPPAGGAPKPKAAADQVHDRAGDALDAIAKQVMEAKAAKAN